MSNKKSGPCRRVFRGTHCSLHCNGSPAHAPPWASKSPCARQRPTRRHPEENSLDNLKVERPRSIREWYRPLPDSRLRRQAREHKKRVRHFFRMLLSHPALFALEEEMHCVGARHAVPLLACDQPLLRAARAYGLLEQRLAFLLSIHGGRRADDSTNDSLIDFFYLYTIVYVYCIVITILNRRMIPLRLTKWRSMALARMEDAMESRKAVSQFKSSCKALVDTIPPAHHLSDAQESIVLSNLQVVESAIRFSHIQQSIAVYDPNTSGTKHPRSTRRLKMEVRVRWKCFCTTLRESCQFCRGTGHIDRWIPVGLLKFVKNRTYLILARRD